MDVRAIRTRVRERLTEQRRLVADLLRLREQLQGSLFARRGACGRSPCTCHRGRGHGPYFVLSNRSGGKGSYAYLDARQVRQARPLVARHREFRRGMRRLRRLNAELVALLRRYQQATAKGGKARVGMAS